MDAYELADTFEAFVASEWPGKAEDKGDLLDFFLNWAGTDGDLIAATEGNHALLLQTFIIVVARFYAYPKRFGAIREFVTQPIEDFDLEYRVLRGYLSAEPWHEDVVRRLRRSR